MAVSWTKTKYPGVRFYEHSTRKNGVQKDRYYAIRYQRDGKRKEEGLGWASEGWSTEKAAGQLGKLKEAHRTGEGMTSLEEKRAAEKIRKIQEAIESEQKEKENTTFDDYFRDTYLPAAKTHKKKDTWYHEAFLVRLWLSPVMGDKLCKAIIPLDIERIKKNLLNEKKSPRTVQYIMATFRQVWNMARRDGIVSGDSPTRSVKLPEIDNKRERYLTRDEADKLLAALKVRCITTYRIAGISLYTGMRRGEIFNLRWKDIDIDRGIIRITDPKAKKTQHAYMNQSGKEIFSEMKAGRHEDLLFPSATGEARTETPDIFDTVVKELDFNKGITDSRHRAYFHTLRHTFASWLVMAGISLYQVQKLMRHTTITMTERYAHLSPDTLQEAINVLDQRPEPAGTAKAEGE
jgi:integrase